MHTVSLSFLGCLLLSSTEIACSQFAKHHPAYRGEDPALIQHQFERMRNAMHAGSVIVDNSFPQNKLLKYKDLVTIENPPKRVKSNHTLKIKYQCSQPSVIIVFMEGNYLQLKEPTVNTSELLYKDADLIFFRKFWPCERSPAEIRTQLPLKFPREILQRPDILLPKVWTMKDITLKVGMVNKDLWNYLVEAKHLLRDQYHVGFEKSHQSLTLPLKFEHPYCRSEKASDHCLAWPLQLIDSISRKKPPKSHPDATVVKLLNHPVVSSEKLFGLPRNFLPFFNPEMRLLNPNRHPKFTVSFVLYLAFPCEKLCALFQHIDDDDKYSSPSIFINDKGQIQAQSRLADNNSYGVLSEWKVPLREWFQLDIQQYFTMTNITMRHGKNFTEIKNFLRSFHMPVEFDYQSGFFTVGASLFARMFDGIIGSATMWRNMLISSDEIRPPSPDHEMFLLGADEFVNRYDELEKMISRRWRYLDSENCNNTDRTKLDVCLPYFIEIIRPTKKNIEAQCPLESQPLPERFKHIESQLVRYSHRKKRSKDEDLLTIIGDRLHRKAKRFLDEKDSILLMRTVIDILDNSAAILHGPSLFLLYVIYANGFGTTMDLQKAKIYLHVGAMTGDKMCIKTLGHKHMTGEDGFPKDDDVAVYYTFNAAFAAQIDRQLHHEGMTEVNRVRLTDEKQMKQQTSEDEDLFQWFKHQAGTGMQEAKRNLGQLLYWGKQGLKRNLKAAFEYYEQAAQDTNDPNALYDYGITLMKGHGTDTNEDKALEVLLQAAEKESPHAYNTLGWYYIRQEGEGMKEKAVEYFEKASELGNVDAAYNLGHMHHLGDYPGQKRNMIKAFQLYYKAASRGHVESSNRVAYILACGIRNYLHRNVKNAYLFAKAIADLSPIMGEIVREALQAFRAQSWVKSAFLYLAAAESGFEIAGYNTAFLIEEDKTKRIESHVEKDCVWRFWNNSANAYVPPPYALNRMGDYHYYGIANETNLKEAINYYLKAARINDPQALFNLACILEDHGDVIDNETLILLGIPESSLRRQEDIALDLYLKCSSIGSEASSMPCYMGFLRMKAIVLWKYSSFLAKVTATAIAIGFSTLLIFASTLLRHQRRTDNLVLSEQGSAEDPGDAPRTHLFQEEIIEDETTPNGRLSSEDSSCDLKTQQSVDSCENGAVMTGDDEFFEGEKRTELSGRAVLEESSEDDSTEDDGSVDSTVFDPIPPEDGDGDSVQEEDKETGELKKTV